MTSFFLISLIEEILSIVNYFSSLLLPILQGNPPLPPTMGDFLGGLFLKGPNFFLFIPSYLKNNKKLRRKKIFNDRGPCLRV